MTDYIVSQQNPDGCIESESNRCPQCDSPTRRFGRTGGVDIECAKHGIIASTRDQRILADGGQTAYDVLARYNDTEGHADRMQAFLDGNLTKNDLVADDIARTLRLSLGQLCLTVEHEQKTEYIWATDTGFVSRTVFDTEDRGSWGPTECGERAITMRLHKNKPVDVRLTRTVDVARPKSAYAEEVRA